MDTKRRRFLLPLVDDAKSRLHQYSILRYLVEEDIPAFSNVLFEEWL